jgi:DNA repair exonuclease SbcCD ATPase subunit
MNLVKAHIDGFGTLVNAGFEFAPGVNVIFGPNETGKTTLHEFLVAMLYGMTKPGQPDRRVYEPTFEQYRPWQSTRRYGGRLEYALARGDRFEVYRQFSARRETIRVHALPGGTDCTAEFPRQRNGEVEFALTHLGLGKDLFASAATIRHASVSALAPAEALATVRDRIAALVDTGREDLSSKKALALLDQSAAAIGSDRAPTRPIGRLRARLAALKDERTKVVAAREELAVFLRRRTALAEPLGALTQRVAETQTLLAAARRAELAAALADLERVSAELAGCDRELADLAPYADFPVDLYARLTGLAREYEIRCSERDALRPRIEGLSAEVTHLEADLAPLAAVESLPANALETVAERFAHLADLDHRMAALEGQEAEAADEEQAANTRAAPLEAQRHAVAALLDAPEDALVELRHLESNVEAARRSLNETQVEGENFHVQTAELGEQLERLAPIFQDVGADIEDLRRRYEAGQRTFEAIREEIGPELNRRRALRFDLGATVQQHLMWAWVLGIFGALVGGLGLVPSVAAAARYLYVGGTLLWAGAAFFVLRQAALRKTLKTLDAEVAGQEARLEAERAKVAAHAASVARLLEHSPYKSLAEYISGYGTYLRVREAHAAAQDEEHRAALRAQQARDRLQTLHTRAISLLKPAGIPLAELNGLADAVTRFRAAHRQARQAAEDLKDARRDLDAAVRRRAAVARQLDVLRSERAAVAEALASQCRAAGVTVTADKGLAGAVDEFKARFRQAHALRARFDERAAHLRDLRAQEAHLADLASATAKELQTILDRAGVSDVPQFRQGIERHERWKAAGAARDRLVERRERLLAGRSPQALKDELAALAQGTDGNGAGQDGRNGNGPHAGDDRPPSALRTEDLRRSLEGDQSALAGVREELARLSARIDSHLAPFRPLPALDEDLAETQARLDRLLLVRDALAMARSTIQEVGRWAYANLAPHLNRVLGQTVSEITDGRYQDVTVDEDLSVWVCVPGTGQRLAPTVFSRGAIDQFYFTLRLGIVDLLTAGREPVPLILDDPFTNYDDERLDRAMAILARRAETNQVLLFTCQRRVRDWALAHAARIVPMPGAPQAPHPPDAQNTLGAQGPS